MDIMSKSVSGGCAVSDWPRSIPTPKPLSRGRHKEMRDDGLSPRQAQVLEIIRRHLKTRSVPPSRSEIAAELGLKHASAVDNHLNSLMKKGWLIRFPSVERGVKLLREGAPLYEQPAELLDIPPGRRMDGKEPKRVHDFDSVATLFQHPPDFFLRLQDDGMDLAGFRPGDVVAVVRGMEPKDGEVVVGKVGQSIALRRDSRWKDKDFEIVGVVVGAIVGTRRST